MLIGEKLKKLRQNKNMTQKELAMRSGISISSIVSYENGLREPKVDTIKCLCDVFEISPDFFYEWMGDNQGLEENHFINRLLKKGLRNTQLNHLFILKPCDITQIVLFIQLLN